MPHGNDVTLAEGSQQLGGRQRLRARELGAVAVELGVDRRRRQAALGERKDPRVGTSGEHRRKLVAAPDAEGRTAMQGEREHRCRARAASGSSSSREKPVPQYASQATSAAAASALPPAIPAATGNRLAHRQVHTLVDPGHLGQQFRGAHREVGVVGRKPLGAFAVQRDGDRARGEVAAVAPRRARRELVVKGYGLQDRMNLVVAGVIELARQPGGD